MENLLPDTTLLVPLLLLLVATLYHLCTKNSKANEILEDDSKICIKYNVNIPYKDEKPVKIQKLFIYPCRGIKGIEVNEVKVSSSGIKYDREWAFVDKENKSLLAQAADCKLTMLRQRLEKDLQSKKRYLIISVSEGHKDIEDKLPSKELKIEMISNPESKGELIVNEKFSGYSEGEKAEQWISAFLGKPVLLLRSPPNCVKELNKNLMIHSEKEDRRKNMLSKAALHIINEASVRYLRKRVLDQYPSEIQSKIKIDTQTFRANFIIDTGKEFDEDSMSEARIGSIMLRIVGYCSRCKAVPVNYDTCDLNPEMEPNNTLSQFRRHPKLGILFGTYHQVDVIESKEQYKRLFRGYPEIKDRPFQPQYGIVKVGDEIRVRVKELKVVI